MSEEKIKSLLPVNATKQETDIELTNAHISEIPIKAADLWNPDKCPAEFLPWLAYSVAISEWDDTWTEAQKRQAIKDSFFVHQKKGTIGAMRKALNTLGADIHVKEWFDTGKEPYTFEVEIGFFDDSAEEDITEKVKRIIERTKNVRSHLSAINKMVTTRGILAFPSTACLSSYITVYPKEEAYG